MFDGSKLGVLFFLFNVLILGVLFLTILEVFMSEDTFFKVANFFLWAYALMGIVGFLVIAYGLCLEFCHV